jgi:hypothetical protein
MVVLNPDHSARGDLLANDLGKAEVGLSVSEPILLVKIHFAGVVVEQRPEDGVGEAVIVAIGNVIVEVDGLAGIFLHETLVD